MKKYLALFLCIFVIASCSKDGSVYENEIVSYLNANGYKFKDTLGIWLVVEDPGGKERPVESSIVSILYTGQYLDGETFDSSGATPTELKLSSAILGLKNGIQLMGKNGKAIIIIPPNEGYGNNPPWGIRKNAVLKYNIELQDFR